MMIHSTRGLKLLFTFFLAVAALFIVMEMETDTVAGDTITVDDDGPADYDNIQDAINAAVEGDTIEVAAGHYNERVGISKRLSLIGSGSESTFIDGGRNGDVMKIGSSSHGSTIRGFNITRSGTNQGDAGIEILSDSNVIEDVILYRNENGIICSQNAHNTIGIAFFVENDIGLNLDRTSDNHIHNSTFINQDRYDIEIGSSQNILLRNNELGYQGIRIFSDEEFGGYEPWWNTHTIDTSNTIGGRPIVYVKNQTSGVVSGVAGQVLIANSQDLIVRNLEIIGGGGGLIVGYSSNITITKNIISENGDGITLYRVDNATVSHNVCEDNGDDGISFGLTDNLTIFNNELRYNDIGIRSGGNQLFVNITGNNCSYNVRTGILIGGAKDTFTVTMNYCYGNGQAGIYLTSADHLKISLNICIGNRYGLFIRASSNTNITNNRFMWNEDGIRGELNSENNLFQQNNCSFNTNAGIFLLTFDSTSIKNNTIIGNQDGITLYADSDDTVAEYNYIIGNTGFGINATDITSGLSIDATNNWWGTASGPYHETDNPSGEGDEVSDNVIFDPWLDEAHDLQVQAYILDVSPNPADDEIKVRFEGIGDNKEINLFAWRSSIDGQFYSGIQSSFKTDQLSIGFHVLHFKVRQKDGNIWSDEMSTTLLIHDRPIPTIEEISPKEALDTDDIYFRGSGTDDGTIEQYAWRSNRDGEFYRGTESEFTYNGFSNGTHNIYLKVMDNYGSWSDETPDQVKIQGRPQAHIDDISPNPALLGENVTFEGRATDDGGINRIIWNSSISGTLDDGLNEITWKDDLPLGEHTITMVVVDNKGVWSYEVSSLLIITLQPEAFIDSINPNPALDTDPVHFQGHGTDGDGTINRYEWRSDLDGPLYSGPDPQFDDPDLSNGTHLIFLRVRDNYDVWSDEVSSSITVYGKPRARINSISPNPALISEDVFYRGSGTDEGGIERYAWRSSLDGEFYNDTGSAFSDANLSLGIHTIFLKVRDNDGIWSDEVSRKLTITRIPDATIEVIDPSPAFDTDIITFNGSGTDDGTIVRYAWRSSLDGVIYNNTGNLFTHPGLSNGTHTIFLKVKDDLGFWSEEVNTTLTIYGRPRAHIDSIEPSPASPFDDITFSGHGADDGAIVRYVWRSSIQGELYNGTNGSFSETGFLRGHHTIFMRVQDDDGFWSEEVSTVLIISDIPVAVIDSISPNPALHVDTIHLEGHGEDNGNIERYVWSSDVDGVFYNGTEGNITPFQLNEGFEGLNLSYSTGGYMEWVLTTTSAKEGVKSARSGDIDDDEFSWMETTFDWPGTLEFYWKVSSEDTDYLRLYIDGKLKDQISGTVGWTKYSIIFVEGGHRVRWSYEKDLSISHGNDAGYVDAISYRSDLTLANGTHVITFQVMDNEGFWSREVSFGLVINGKPMVLALEIDPSPAYHNDIITFNATVLDDGNITNYVWWSSWDGELYNGSSPVFQTTHLQNRTHIITFMALDDSGTWTDPQNISLNVRGRPIAYIDSVSPNPALSSDVLNFKGHGTDDGEIITYVWRSSIDGEFYNGDENQTNVTTLSNGLHTIFFKVRDNKGHWSVEVNTTLEINGIPQAFIQTVSPDPALDTEFVTFSGTATDDGDVDRFVWRSSINEVFYDGNESSISLDNLSLGFHVIYFKVQDDKGVWSSEVTSTLNITERPVAVIDLIDPRPAVHTDIITFRGHGEDDGTIIRYEWRSSMQGTIYDGTGGEFSSSTLRNGTHVIDFRVRDNYNFWSQWVTLPLDINGIPQAIINSFDPSEPTDRDRVNFYGSEHDDGSIVEYAWRSDRDGNLSDTKNFGITNLTNGTHIISFRVMDNKGLWSEETNTSITINGYPTASIDGIVPKLVNEGSPVWFYGSSHDDVNIVEYQWRTDDLGILSTNESFSTNMLPNGTHRVYFKARDDQGLWSDEASDTVTINGIPIANIISITPDPVNKAEVVTFSGNGTDHEGPIKDYSWRSDLVPGILSTKMTFQLSTLPNGTHMIYFKVRDQNNVWSKEVSLSLQVNGIPVANIIEITPNPGVETRKITFKASGTDDGGEIVGYNWRSTLNGSLETLSTFSRTDLSVGEHIIYLRVKDNLDVWSPEVSMTLLVHPVPKVTSMSIVPVFQHSGSPVVFYARGNVDGGSIVKYNWSSSLDGYMGNENEFTSTELSNGTHVISVKALDEKGIWSDERSMTITVNGRPHAEIVNVSKTRVTQGDPISFEGKGTDGGSIELYEWSTSPSVILYSGVESHLDTFLYENGTNTIYLRVQDNHGAWSDKASTQVGVNGIPIARIDHVSKFTAEEGEQIFFRAGGEDDSAIVEYLWESSRDGVLYQGPDEEFRIDSLSLGNHTINLTVKDDEGVWSSAAVTNVLIIEEKDESGMPWLMIVAGGGILLVIVLVLIFLVILPKKRSGDGKEKTGSSQFPGQPGIAGTGGGQQPQPQPQSQIPGQAPVPPNFPGGSGMPPPGPMGVPMPGQPQGPVPPPTGQPHVPGPMGAPMPGQSHGPVSPPAGTSYTPVPPGPAVLPGVPVPPSPAGQQPGPVPLPAGPQPGPHAPGQPGTADAGPGQQPQGHWFCPSCGNKLDQKYIFCLKCGHKR